MEYLFVVRDISYFYLFVSKLLSVVATLYSSLNIVCCIQIHIEFSEVSTYILINIFKCFSLVHKNVSVNTEYLLKDFICPNQLICGGHMESNGFYLPQLLKGVINKFCDSSRYSESISHHFTRCGY